MRDTNQLQYPHRGLPRDMPAEAHPMQMSLRQRRIAPIKITEKMLMRHAWYRNEKARRARMALAAS